MRYYLYISIYIPLVTFLLFLSGCALTVEGLIRQEEQATADYHSLSELPFEKTTIGYNEDFKLGRSSSIAEFSTGKSHFKAIELPAANEEYYIIVKSYFISIRTDPLFFSVGAYSGEAVNPYVFQPYIITLDEDYNIIRTIDEEAFQLHTDIEAYNYSNIFNKLEGNTWLETLIPFNPDIQEKYAIILTSPELVKGLTKLPNVSFAWQKYWPVAFYEYGYGIPDGVYHFPIGKLKLSIVSPQDIFLDIEKKINEMQLVTPGQTFQKKWFSVQSPNDNGFHIAEVEDYIWFQRVMPEGSGWITLFVYTVSALGHHNLQDFIDSAINEHSEYLIDFSYSTSMITVDEAPCYRIDFKGKEKDAFLAPIEGYDIFCVPPEAEGASPMIAVRIGGNVGYSPATAQKGLPDLVNDFLTNIKFINK